MDTVAVELARDRVRRAEKAMEALRAAQSFESAEDAWSDFLLAASAIYSKLEQGSKTSGPSMGWFGRKKNERRKDPLLRYMHLARNTDEHGIVRVVKRYVDTGPIWGRQPKFGERIPVTIQEVDRSTGELVGEKSEGFYSGSTVKLVRVIDDRFGDHCDPPTTHLDKHIKYPDEPFDIAELAFAYLQTLVAEADAMAKSATSTA